MRLFDKLYNASKEAVKAVKKPLQERKIKRAFESALDSLEDEKVTMQESHDDCLSKLVNGEYNNDSESLMEIVKSMANELVETKALDELIDALKVQKGALFSQMKEGEDA